MSSPLEPRSDVENAPSRSGKGGLMAKKISREWVRIETNRCFAPLNIETSTYRIKKRHSIRDGYIREKLKIDPFNETIWSVRDGIGKWNYVNPN